MGLFWKALDKTKTGRFHHGAWLYSEFQTFLQVHGPDLIELYREKVIPELNDALIGDIQITFKDFVPEFDYLIMLQCLELTDQVDTEKSWTLAGLACSYFSLKHAEDWPKDFYRTAQQRLDFCMLKVKAFRDAPRKAIEDKEIEIAGLKAQLEAAQDNYNELKSKFDNMQGYAHDLEKENQNLEAKCREYEERENLQNGIVPGILTIIFHNAVERVKKIEHLDGVTPSLFDAEKFDQCPNAYDQLRMIYNNGFSDKYEGEKAVKKQLREYLLDEYHDLYPYQRERLMKCVKQLNLAILREQFYDLDEEELQDMVSDDFLGEMLLTGFEDFIKNYRVVSIVEKYGLNPDAVTTPHQGRIELFYPEGAIWIK